MGLVLIYVSASYAFGIGESTSIAQIVFPYALAFDPTILENPWLVLGLALLQFPLYGIILAVTWPRTYRRAIALIFCLLALLGTHFIAVKKAHVANAAWRETFVKWE